ncbi:MAG: phosphoribosyl-ATP diphosphatase [Roseiarcus sp.]
MFAAVSAARGRDPTISRTSKLFHDGVRRKANKLVEKAVELGRDAVQMNRESAILESADVPYHLIVIRAERGITPADVLNELDRRERLYGIAGKLPKRASTAEARRRGVAVPSANAAS